MESLDGETIPEKGHDIGSLVAEITRHVNIKVAAFIFFFGMFIFSDVFVGFMPADASEVGSPNLKGTTIQLGVLCLFYLVIDMLVQMGIL